MTVYEPVIGLEIHAQLNTKSKMFVGADNDSEGKEPNTAVSYLCFGTPGTLPVVNREALVSLYRLGAAIGCAASPRWYFERKQYFYPDLPKAYQITSQTSPPLMGGAITFYVNGERLTRSFEHIHIEEDAGKLSHSTGGSLVDLNRAGTPLLEMVTDPVFRSPQEAKAFMQELRLILRFLGISEADMEKGHMRADGNISLRPVGTAAFGKKVEVKNINSFSALERALEYEIKRQTAILEEGGTVMQETRGWDDPKGVTVTQRSKEMAHDYRYFPEPDMPPFQIKDEKLAGHGEIDLAKIKSDIPEMPEAKRARYATDFGIELTDCNTIIADQEVMRFFENTAALVPGREKKAANMIITDLLGYLNKEGKVLADIALEPVHIATLIEKTEAGEISTKIAKEVFLKVLAEGIAPEVIIEREGLRQVSDTGELEKIIADLVAANPAQVEEYRAGKEAVLMFFVGQVMKATRGQANPGMVQELLKKALT